MEDKWNTILEVVGKHIDFATQTYLDSMHGILPGGGIIKGIPEDEEDKQRFCAELAILLTMGLDSGGREVCVNIDDLIYAVDIFRIYATSMKLVAFGALKIREDIKDEYGFPAFEVVNINKLEEIKNGH